MLACDSCRICELLQYVAAERTFAGHNGAKRIGPKATAARVALLIASKSLSLVAVSRHRSSSRDCGCFLVS